MNKKWVTIGVLGVLVLGGGYWGYKKFTAKPVVAANVTAKATIGDVTKVISATGTVNFPHSIPLQFSNNGQVVELDIKDGDIVKKGQVLARIDDTALKTSVGQQEANLLTAQAKLQSLQDGYNDQTKAEAQSTLAKAKQNLITAQQNADPAYLANQVLLANQTVKQASDALAKAQQNGDTSSIQSAQNSLNQAVSELTTAQNQQNGGAAQALTAAQADVTAAQYKVDQQGAGPSEADLQSAYASISQAQAQLDSAKTALAEATILAPTDAVVIDTGMQLYQYTTDDTKITITPLDGTGSNLEVVADIDQADIGQVKIGQKVDITLDAYPDDHSSGVVSLVALQGTTTSNVTTFGVTVDVDQASDKLRSGMNANLDIIVDEAKGVLTIPSEAIKTRGNEKGVMVPVSEADQSGNGSEKSTTGTEKSTTGSEKSTNRQAQGNVKFITVEFGLDDGTNVEVKSGLKEGQEVITSVSSSTTTKTSSGGFLFGGGNRNAGSPPR
ncbi:multidrug resistance efflux pump [Desulfosporosinus orientis DSM 765]|uniref:Multidrug resistance efflux pump n=1 Tax=Desulfosporosinus orientis (strain ATCC 19365 / DSM 765 / NCIMB 8382 / VKM B-1628 / Singapore I) TaxID=768706 RepID=G7W9U9_DESOD|nr:HlyD family efflux transporter periplasmic adaptor subunit [Desulfosporosinus orientis]AET70665.1 multidrug resistance efflux pump [Desulfosporosinus orientis DSM 765]